MIITKLLHLRGVNKMEKLTKYQQGMIAWFIYAAGMIAWLLVDSFKQQATIWILVHSLATLIFLSSIPGVWFSRRLSVNMSLVVAAYFFGLGIYLAYLGWNLWIFQTPTLFDQICAAFPMHVILLITIPILWIIFCLKKSWGSRERF